jgi:hypothetical protein
VKFWIHDIFVRPQHPHGAENRFSEFATVFFGCVRVRQGVVCNEVGVRGDFWGE